MPWFPPNKYLWDFWFAWKEDELHVFYLQAEQQECNYNPDWRHDRPSIGHAVLSQWGWKEVNIALTKAEGDAWDNLSLWTGSIIQKSETGPYYMFYTARRREDVPIWTPSEWQRPQHIGAAVSEDMLTWQRTEASRIGPVIPNPGSGGRFDGVSWRDPFVIREEDRWFYAFICARLNPEGDGTSHLTKPAFDAGSVIAWVRSSDLDSWEHSEPGILLASEDFYQMEVPQVFWRRTCNGKRFYLLFCAQEKDCSRSRRKRMPPEECQTGTYYVSSRELPNDYQGIPELEEPAHLLAPGLYAGKLIRPQSHVNPIFFGFVWADAAGYFVGGLSDPIHTQFDDDGTIKLLH